jgi:threonine dehydrogenase-like Zn-dependent dehydrogenase
MHINVFFKRRHATQEQVEERSGKRNMLTDRWRDYTPSDPIPPVPPFPCTECSACNDGNRVCQRHKYVLFVKTVENGKFTRTIEIPFGNWENWGWYADRIGEVTGLPVDSFRITFAGCQRNRGDDRHTRKVTARIWEQ